MRISVGPSVHTRLRNSKSNITGYLATRSGESLPFSSQLERDWAIVLDFDDSFTRPRWQPFSLYREDSEGSRRYTPDYSVDLLNPRGWIKGVIYEVKPHERLKRKWEEYAPMFKATINHCRSNGLLFSIVTEQRIYTPYFQNAYFLRDYRDYPDPELISDKLIYYIRLLGETTAQELLEASFTTPKLRNEALPIVYKLVANRQFEANLLGPFTYHSPIWLKGA